jgi:hypothetical protein
VKGEREFGLKVVVQIEFSMQIGDDEKRRSEICGCHTAHGGWPFHVAATWYIYIQTGG